MDNQTWYKANRDDDRTCVICGRPAYNPNHSYDCIIRDADDDNFIMHEHCQTERDQDD